MTDQLRKTARMYTIDGCAGRDSKLQVIGNEFVFSVTAPSSRIGEIVKAMGIPAEADETIVILDSGKAEATFKWVSHADRIFGPGGVLDNALTSYEMRQSQLYAARLIQRGIEMGMPSIVEAPTGTGKSFAYLAIALAMGKTVIIATSNKALQTQLYHKDVPFLVKLLRPDATFKLLQGRRNYLCLDKMEEAKATFVLNQNRSLSGWVDTQLLGGDGNVGDYEAVLSPIEVDALVADDGCTGKSCGLYGRCFYYRQRHREVDVTIANHSLVAVQALFPRAQILPAADLMVVDEAHQFATFMRGMLADEFTTAKIEREAKSAMLNAGFKDDGEEVKWLHGLIERFRLDVSRLDGDPRQIDFSDVALDFITEDDRLTMDRIRLAIRGDEADTESREAKASQKRADRFMAQMESLENIATIDEHMVRWVALDDSKTVNEKSVFHCDPLTATWLMQRARGEKVAGSVAGRTSGEWIEDSETSDDDWSVPHWTFLSATLATPDFGPVMREWGIDMALDWVADSPFDYRKNMRIYVPRSTTEPDSRSPEYLDYVSGHVRQLVMMTHGGAFCLFTSVWMMENVAANLRRQFEGLGLRVFVQNETPRDVIVSAFKEHDNCVLFATRTFFEGVDIQGRNLRLVIIDKLPFPSPNPLSDRQGEIMKRWAAESGKYKPWEIDRLPFDMISVPEMTIAVKQGLGRLIRTQNDFGVVAILDTRIWTKYYGRKKVVPSLPDTEIYHSFHQLTYWAEEEAPGHIGRAVTEQEQKMVDLVQSGRQEFLGW